MKSLRSVLILTAAWPWFLGCSTHRMIVTLDPPGTAVRTARLVGKDGSNRDLMLDNANRIVVPIEFPDGPRTKVTIAVETEGGVSIEKAFDVIQGEEAPNNLSIPAELTGKVDNPGPGLSVELDGQPLILKGDTFSKRAELKQNQLNLVLEARNEHDVRDRATVDLQAGMRNEAHLDLQLRPKLAASPTQARFDEEVTFSAKGSNPRVINSYSWNFGDGTPEVQTKEPSITHRYKYEPHCKTPVTYSVSLRIQCGNLRSDPVTTEVTATLAQETMSLGLEVFPKTQRLRPGQTAQFRLTPRDGFFPLDVENFAVSFGDGPPITVDSDGAPLAITRHGNQWKTLTIIHAFAKAGLYEVTATYAHKTKGLTGPYQARLDAFKIMVVDPVLSEAELLGKAWEDLHAKLARILADAIDPADAPLVLSAIDDANFTPDSKDGQAIQRLTNLMVAKGYRILERGAPILSRLAPEAVVDIRAQLDGKAAQKVLYRESLDYGIRARHESEQKPIQYSVSLEGTADWMTRLENQSRGTGEQSGAALHLPGNRERSEIDKRWDNLALETFEKLPLLVARFDTAKYLVAVRVISEGPDLVEPAASFNTTFDRPMQSRTAQVRLQVRVLNRAGQILKSAELVGQASQNELP